MKRYIAGLLLSAVAGVVCFGFQAQAAIPNLQSDGARRITPVELRQLLKKGEAILIDVRSVEAYRAGHIKGARLIPATEIGNRAGQLPRDKFIATYCS